MKKLFINVIDIDTCPDFCMTTMRTRRSRAIIRAATLIIQMIRLPAFLQAHPNTTDPNKPVKKISNILAL